MNELQNAAKAYALYEGTFSVGLDKKFNEINRQDPPSKGALKLSLNPFLIQSGDKNILFDAGIGDFGEGTSTARIRGNLEKHGLTEFDITDVFASHLHYDHIGGLAGKSAGYWELTFPEANIWASREGWQKMIRKDEYYDEEKTTFLHFLDSKANLCFLDDGDQPYPEIRVKQIGGHTEFSQVLLFDDGDQKFMMAGDVLAHRGEVNRKFAAKYDYDPKRSMKIRQKLTEKAWKENYIIMGYHETHHPLFKLTDYSEQQGYRINSI